MQHKEHIINNKRIAEIQEEGIIIHSADDGLDLLGTMYYQGFDSIIIRKEHLIEQFFDLKTGIAGEILQKFSNYRMRLTIIGDFRSFQSKSMQDFMFESNKTGHICFVASVKEALEKLGEQ